MSERQEEKERERNEREKGRERRVVRYSLLLV